MSFRKIILLLALTASTATATAQELIVGADFVTRFDNREYANNDFNEPMTLFSARLTPRIGVQWMEKNRLMVGVEMLQDFGQKEKFLSEVNPLVYYQFSTPNVQANAGIFDRKELMGDYSRAFFSDSTAFYNNRINGFLGRYKSTQRAETYVELAVNWEGMYSYESREMFRVLTAGRYTLDRGLYFGYAFSMFHFAGSKAEENVSDNLLLNPYLGWKFRAYFDFDVKAGFLMAPQRVRRTGDGWNKPCGGQLDLRISRWGVKLENNLYLGQSLQPYFAFHGHEFYAGEYFYGTTKHIYNRTWIGYDRSFFNDTMHVEAGMIFHYDGTGMGTQQLVKLSVDIEKLFSFGAKKNKN